MARRKVSNPLALAVLSCLAERPMHPYEMSTTMRERGKHESIKLNYGSLYSVVESLQKHGLIAPRETVKDGRRPERTVYEITSAGRLRVRRLAGRADRHAGEGLPDVRGRAVADRRAAAGRRGPAAAAALGGAALAAAGRRPSSSGTRRSWACRSCSWSRPTTGAARSRPRSSSWTSWPRRSPTAASTASTTGAASTSRYAAGEEVTPFRLPSKDAPKS
jgi:DNA-binding PadR family transcriptional regulator